MKPASHSRLNTSLTMVGFAAALVCASSAVQASDKDDVLATNAQFYAALNVMFTGDAAPMLAVWSHGEDVTTMGPTGKYNVGWAAVREDWESQARMKLGGRVEPTQINVTVGKELAVLSDYEIGENTNADGKKATVKLRGTSMFRKEDGVWKMIGHHTDTLPYLDK